MKRLGLMLLAAGLLTGCGFHLRGSGGTGLPEGTPIVYDASNPDGEFARVLKRKLEGAGVAFKSAEQAAGARRLHVLAERTNKRELTINPQGRVSEYEVILSVDFTVAAPGAEAGLPQTLSASRAYTYDRNNVLAVNEQEAFLLADLRQNLADQLMRRLERAGQ